jgi:hypothetical protein
MAAPGTASVSLWPLLLILIQLPLSALNVRAQNAPVRPIQIGIDPRRNLTLETEEQRQKILDGIHSLGATWVRDGFAASPHGPADLVDVVRRAKALNLRFVLQIVQVDADYDGPLQRNRCGWNAKALSKINVTKYVARLRKQFDALKAAGLTIDAFEIGNEDDTDCYDGDIPTGHPANQQEIETAAEGYGKFLMASAVLIHDPHYYPGAKIITFGMTHASNPVYSIVTPAKFVAMLRNVGGVNYLDNEKYHVDGFGTHIYASPNNTTASVQQTFAADSAALGFSKPFWLTEWGFLDGKAFPNKRGETLSEGMTEYLSAIDSIDKRIQLGPLCFFSYGVWLADENGNLLPQSQVLARRAKASLR